MSDEIHKCNCNMNRRHFLSKTSLGLGAFALASLLGPKTIISKQSDPFSGALEAPHIIPKAKRIIYLFQSGGPSQHDMFDYKPKLEEMNGEDLPPSVRGDQRLTGMTANQSSFPMAGARFNFKRRGKSGAWVSDLLPYTAKIADELCFIKTVYTEEINHDPAITFFQTGSSLPGMPSMGSWISYGLGSENENLPAFTVLISRGTGRPFDQPLYSRLWGSGFLPSLHQGVQFRSGSDPVLNLQNPDGVNKMSRRNMLAALKDLNQLHLDEYGDPEITTRIAQYEMAYRMQTSVPETMDLSDEPDSTYELYGEDARTPGTYAANCLLARRLAERDVKFIQLYHMGWDQHDGIPNQLPLQCKDIDQASAALVQDLKQRGLLEDTLVIWGGEFGRTAYCQGPLTKQTYGRDHHPRCFTIWMAGGGVKQGITYGKTDEFGYNIVENPVHIHNVQATILHLMGIDHEKLTYRTQGRRFRLTDVHGEVVHDIIS
jgi:hypothetical protein